MKTGKFQIDYPKVMGRYDERLGCDCGEFSATRGDLWLHDPNEKLECSECGADMWLSRRGHIVGKDEHGHAFSGTVWIEVAYPVTPTQLQDLDGSRLVEVQA